MSQDFRGNISTGGGNVGCNNLFVNVGQENDKLLATLKLVDRGRYTVPPCMPGTRNNVFETVDEWLDDIGEPNILWIHGSPGSGKSTIASSLVSKFTECGRLGSIFAFKRGDITLSDPTVVWRTVAHDLSRYKTFADNLVPVLKSPMFDPGRPDILLDFRYLIKEPFIHSFPDETPIIVIDAVDECDFEGSRAGQRKFFIDTITQWSSLPRHCKLIVTGRDDRMPNKFRDVCKQVTLLTGADVNESVNRDIRCFFETRLAEFDDCLDFEMLPREQVLKRLTTRAAGLFIWADTVMTFVEEGIYEERLERVLNGSMGGGDNITKLYQQILDLSFPKPDKYTLNAFYRVVGVILFAKVPLHKDDLPFFSFERRSSVKAILDKLSSVISIGADKRVRISHLSFTEFLCDPGQCPKPFYIDQIVGSQRITMACFRLMRDGLRFNICDLETSHLFNNEVKDLSQRIDAKVGRPLLYACRFWASHVQSTMANKYDRHSLMTEVEEFLYTRLLFWLEVMSLADEISAANISLLTVAPLIAILSVKLSDFIRDASRFIVNFYEAISNSAPHIYLSALPFSPSEALITKHYKPHFPMTISVLCGIDKNWPACTNVFHGHTSSAHSVAFSPDGTRVASGSSDHTIRIWDVETGETIAGPFEGHTDSVFSVAFSPDGTRVTSGSRDDTIRIWDVETGETIAGPFEGHTDSVFSVAFSPDGTRVASGSSDDTIRIWDVETGETIAGPFEGHTSSVFSVAFSPDGTRVASGSWDDTIRIWDVETGETIAGPFEGHTSSVLSVAFSPDGTRVASGSRDHTIRIWDVETGETIAGPFEGHTSSVMSVAFSPDGTRVASGSWDDTIRIWDVETGETIAGPFEGHTSSVYSVVFSPNGTRVASGSSDDTIRIWDVETGETIAGPFEGHTDSVMSVAFSPDGTRVASGSRDHTIRIWDVETGETIAGPFEGHTDSVLSVAFSPDGTRVASGSRDHTIRIWDVETGETIAGPFEGHTDSVFSVAFSPDGTRVASGSRDHTIRIWDVETGETIAGPFEGHTDSVYSVAFSPNGTRVASGSEDDTIRIWDVETGEIIAGPFEGHTSSVSSVAFSPDGTRVASGSWDDTIRIWDVETGEIIAGPFEGHTDSVYSVAFSPNGTRVASGSRDDTIRIWDVETGEIIAGPFEGHTSSVISVAFSPDGTRVASGSEDDTIRILDVETGETIAGPFEGHTDSVISVAFSPDGTRVASGSRDHTIRIWDVETGETIAGPFEGHKSSVDSVAFSPDGTRVASGSEYDTVSMGAIPTYLHSATHTNKVASIGGAGALECFRANTLNGIEIIKRGWVCSTLASEDKSKCLVIWVPLPNRKGVCAMETLLILGTRTTRLDLSRFVHGNDWAQCYVPTIIP